MATVTATVMFTDLVDSTALMSRVGEATAETLRREHFGVLRTAIDGRGGQEVKNLGDGLMVVFTSAADAVAAAVDIQRALGRRNRSAAEALVVRIGIALGDADVDEGDYFGVPVVQASRLCAKAAGGEVLCSDIVRLLAGSRVDAAFDPVGELELKGLAEPVATSRVTWTDDEEGDESSSPTALPTRLAEAVTDTFVGRRLEAEVATTAWKRARAERACRMVLLSGEPGIGKTTLVAHLADTVSADGAVVVYGRCDEDLGIPYQPWIEALSSLVATLPDEVVRAHVDDRGASLARLVPALGRRVDTDVSAGEGGDAERFVLLGCVVDLLERAGATAPVMVVLDDLHWADRQTLQVLRHIATSAVAEPLLVVGTFRDSDVAAGDPMSDLLAALHRVPAVERIPLRGLDDHDVLDLLERAAGHEMDDSGVALRDAVLAETAGNPFFVNEILRHLAETGAIHQDETGRWVSDIDIRSVGLPVSVTEVIGRRIATLGADAQRILTLASVVGREFDVGVVAVAADVDELYVIDQCDAAVDAAVLRPTAVVDRYTFVHALVERTLYDSMSPSRRARAHRTVAEAIEAVHGEDRARSAELAHHWTQAVTPADASKALQYAQLAGDRALSQFAPDDALRWYEQAIDLLDRVDVPPHRRAELLIGLGIAQRQTGRVEHRATLLDAARIADEVGAVDLYVAATLAGFRGWHSRAGMTDHERLAAIDRALEIVGGHDSAERARLLVFAACERLYVSSLDERLALVDEATTVVRRLGDDDLLLWVLAQGCMPIRGLRTVGVRSDRLAEARTMLTDTSGPEARIMIDLESMFTALDVGDLDAVDAALAAAREQLPRVPESGRRWADAYLAATVPMVRGDLDEAERIVEHALAYGMESGQPDAFAIYATQLLCIRYHRGTIHELLPLIEQSYEASPELHTYKPTIALAAAFTGDPDRTARLFEADIATSFELPDDENWLLSTGAWASAAAQLRHVEAAEILHGRLDPYRRGLVHAITVQLPAVATVLGQLEHVLGRFDDADRSFEAGDALNRRAGSPMLTAEGRSYWAAMLVDRDAPGDRDRARELASEALAVAVEGGYGYTEARAREVLRRLGG